MYKKKSPTPHPFSGKTSLIIGLIWLLFQGVLPSLINNVLSPFFSPCFTTSVLLIFFLQSSKWTCLFQNEKHIWLNLWEANNPKTANLYMLVWGILLALIFFPSQTLLCHTLGALLDKDTFPPQPSAQYFIHTLRTGAYIDLFWSIFLISILAPLAEEFLFRGVFQQWAGKFSPPLVAVLFSSTVFTMLHIIPSASVQQNIWLLAGTFYTSLFFGYIYNHYSSLYAAIGAHMLMNSLTLLFIFFTFKT